MKLDEQSVEVLFNLIDGRRSYQDLQVFDGIVKNLDIQDNETFELFSKFVDHILNVNHFFPNIEPDKSYIIVKDGKWVSMHGLSSIYKSVSSANTAIINYLNRYIGSIQSNYENTDILYPDYVDSSIEAVRAKNLFKTGKSMKKYLVQSGILKVITLEEHFNNFCKSKI